MSIIHYLNVNEGDCTVIQHNSDRVTVIDVCNAQTTNQFAEDAILKASRIPGNFNQKAFPVNPISYLKTLSINSVFRFILTHPDMDHMDGIEDFFSAFRPANFWDTANNCEKQSWGYSKFAESDWLFYKNLRDTDPQDSPKRLVLHAGAQGQYFTTNGSGEAGDGLYVLAPTPTIVASANECGDYNDCSYVILYRTGNHKILFAGDSQDETWDHILENYEQDVVDIDLLIAPHHGRDSNRSYEFLSTLNPALTFFGNARSEHLAYDAWINRGLRYLTNNQAGCMVVDTSTNPMTLYVTNETYAKKVSAHAQYNSALKAYHCQSITR